MWNILQPPGWAQPKGYSNGIEARGRQIYVAGYVKDKHEYLARARELGAVYQEVIGRHYPVMALVQVADLVEDRAKVEIEATAVVPD